MSERWKVGTLRLSAVVLCAAILRPVDFGLLTSENSSRRHELAGTLGAVRFTMGRVTGGFQFAPLSEHWVWPALGRESRPAILALRLAAERRPSLQSIADAAVAQLVARRPERAARAFAGILAQRMADAATLSDASAAYFELGTVRRNPELIFKALTLADRAIAAPGAPVEAYFNRALALEALKLQPATRQAWSAYLTRDAASGWAAEARQRLLVPLPPRPGARWSSSQAMLVAAVAGGDAVAVRRLIQAMPQQVRQYGEEKLLESWGASRLADRRDEAHRTLVLAQTLGETLGDLGGDVLLRDAVAAMNRCGDCGELARGQQEFGAGLRLFQERRYAAALPQLQTARALLARQGSPLSLWAGFYAGVCDYQAARYGEASACLEALRTTAEGRHYSNLLGRIHWMLGLIKTIEGEVSFGLAEYHAAARSFAATGEEENAASVNRLLAQGYRRLGDEAAAWPFRLAAASQVWAVGDPVRRQSILEELAQAALDAGEPLTALTFQAAAVASARTSARSDPLAAALLRRAAILDRLGRFAEAQSDLEHAKAGAGRGVDASVRRTIEGDLLAVEGELEISGNPRAATTLLSEALRIYSATSFGIKLSRIHLLRAEAYRALGDDPAAEADLGTALVTLEKQSRLIENLDQRALFFDQGRRLLDAIVAFYSERHEAVESLALAERARSQCLLELRGYRPAAEEKRAATAGAAASAALSVAEIQERLPATTVLVEYAVLADRLVAWLVTRQRVVMAVTAIPERGVTALADLVVDAAQRRGPSDRTFTGGAALAFDVLIRPFLGELGGTRQLIVVPDKDLYKIPFLALYDGSRAAPLISRFQIVLAPSATAYVRFQERSRELARPRELRAVVLGAPQGALEELPDLPGARREAAAVAGLYRNCQLLVGERATKRAFLAAVADADVVHIAAHAVTREDTAMAPALLFREADGSVAALRLGELRLGHARLVFLSACGTALGTLSPTEGVLSPARLFLGAGTSTVVASLWDVDDDDAERLAILFHRRWRAGMGVAEALRSAALELWRRGEPPCVWAAFEPFGAAA